MIIHWKRLDPAAMEPLNAYGDDAGWDLHAIRPVYIEPGTGMDVPTGVAVAIPPGHYGRIVGRSSTLRKRGLMVMEGIIDCGFRGELYAYAFNPGRDTVKVEPGQSIAQLIVSPVPLCSWQEVGDLPVSARGDNGFGSSGR